MKTSKITMYLFTAVLLSSCAIHSGYMTNSTSLTQANFDYVQSSISGSARTIHVIGLGGLAKQAIVEEAKRDMLTKHPLKTNQALANVTVNWKDGFYLIIMERQCTVTADVVEFYTSSETRTVVEQANQTSIEDIPAKTGDAQTANHAFKVGDKVLYKDTFKKISGTIYKIDGNDFFIKYTNKNGREKIRKTSASWIKKID